MWRLMESGILGADGLAYVVYGSMYFLLATPHRALLRIYLGQLHRRFLATDRRVGNYVRSVPWLCTKYSDIGQVL